MIPIAIKAPTHAEKDQLTLMSLLLLLLLLLLS